MSSVFREVTVVFMTAAAGNQVFHFLSLSMVIS